MLADLRYGSRILLKTPAVFAVAVLSLALGIGASTTIYSLIYAAVLHPFPYRDVPALRSVVVRKVGRPRPRIYLPKDVFIEIDTTEPRV